MPVAASRPTTGTRTGPRGLWRHSRSDAILVVLSLLQGGMLALLPAVVSSGGSRVMAGALLACSLWWGSNTIAHNFLHRPFFSIVALNRIYAVYLSVVLGVPQALWKERHLAHHAGRRASLRLHSGLIAESMAVLSLWLGLLLAVPAFFLGVYLPAYAVGMLLCLLQGHFEHAPATASHYGRFYNLAFFNDGYHVEHHRRPDCHWSRVPALHAGERASRFPPVLRWLDWLTLEGLERAALRSRYLQAWLLRCHAHALSALAAEIGPVERITIVGGGLFPRSAILLRGLYPRARIRVIDASAQSLTTARAYCDAHGLDLDVEFDCARFDGRLEAPLPDLLVTPLSLIGDRRRLYASPPAARVLVHDWLWNAVSGSGGGRDGGGVGGGASGTDGSGVGGRGCSGSAIVSVLLLKRINLVRSP